MTEEQLKMLAQLTCQLSGADKSKAMTRLKNKKYSGTMNIRLAPKVHQKLAIEAYLRGTSMNQVINHYITQMQLIEDYLQDYV